MIELEPTSCRRVAVEVEIVSGSLVFPLFSGVGELCVL